MRMREFREIDCVTINMVCKKCKSNCVLCCCSGVYRGVPSGEKKLGRVICPDPWKSGARNTIGRLRATFVSSDRIGQEGLSHTPPM